MLEEYGLSFNADRVIRSVFYKYFHPKEALIGNGILNRALAQASGKQYSAQRVSNQNKGQSFPAPVLDEDEYFAQALSFVFVDGATVSVARSSRPILSTGSACFPIHRPVAAVHEVSNGGRIVIVGSVDMFSDKVRIVRAITKAITRA